MNFLQTFLNKRTSKGLSEKKASCPQSSNIVLFILHLPLGHLPH